MMRRLLLVYFIFISLVFGQLLDETRRLLQMQGMAQPSQVTEPPPSLETPETPVVFPQPSQRQAVSPEGQFEIKEPPQRATDIVLPSDVIVIKMKAMNYVVGVDWGGYAELPIGVRYVQGLTAQKIEEMIFDVTGEKAEVQVITSPKLNVSMQTIIPQYVSLLGDFMRPTVSPPGSLGFCIGNAMGLNQTASGKITIYCRGKIEKLDFNKILRSEPEKLNLYIEPGSVVVAHKSTGWLNLESVGNVFSRLRDVALTIIAYIELDNYGRQRGWW